MRKYTPDVTSRRREPVLLAIMIVGSSLVLIVFDSTPLATEFSFPMFAFPSIAAVWALAGIRSTVLFMRLGRRRSWNLSFARGFVVAAAILVAVGFFPFLHECTYLGSALRFAANRAYYDGEVAHLPADDQPRVGFFSWGGMLWASRALVYDENDELARPPGQQSVAWRDNRRYLQELTCGEWHARALWSHYYIVDFTC